MSRKIRKKALVTVLLLVAIVILIIVLRYSGTPIEKELPESLGVSKAVMLEANSSNWGSLDQSSDYLSSRSYRLQYDGTLEYYENYNKSGKKNFKSGEVSAVDLRRIYSVLEGDFLKRTEDLNSSDGTGWEIEYFNESGKVIHQFYGYIYGYDIEQVIELLNQYLSG